MEQIFLFLDIDGVVNTSINADSQFLGTYQDKDLRGSPSPLVNPLLKAIDRAEHIKPFWISSGWREHSNIWNRWAGITPWTVGYPITFAKINYVISRYRKQLELDEIDDSKTIAVIYHSGNNPKIVWIEDGFSQSAIAWAALDRRVNLISTIHPSDPLLLGIQAWNIESILESLNIELETL
ncbi:MAG: hypothetical protein DCF19_09890 [Pseudanabaena frigida]|uniref:Uncharacterized protein n=1 Tax=Pseudanabaena frigida TaxID=945775 RepID=A0A2W4Y1U8_9CYAN|nr:MAG: hypothetical protein DCF19_09890 [Pseudanabaena frigida]